MTDIAAICRAAKLKPIAIEQDGAQAVVTVAPLAVVPETAIKALYRASGARGIVYNVNVASGAESFRFTPGEVVNV